MGLIVQKFGGTSVGTPERVRSVADRVVACRKRGNELVVVVSAMGHTTDELIALAHQVSSRPPHREMDMLLTAGERISMALLSMALADRGVPALSFTGSQSGIITDSSHRRARIRRILADRVRSTVADGKVAIVAGFQGVSETKEITTLGRGGSDTTAVALAATLGAEHCEIYTDVAGVYSADPRIVPEARLWKRIAYDPMIELATLGAGVLHPRCVEMAKRFQVPLRVLSSFDPQEGGTEIMAAANSELETPRVLGVTADPGKALLTVELMRTTVITALWDAAREAHLSVVAPQFSEGTVRFFADEESRDEWKKRLDRLAVDGFVRRYEWDASRCPVSVVGERFAQDGTALHEVVDALAQSGVSVTIGLASALSITVAVPRTYVGEAIRGLHARFTELAESKEG